MRRNALAALLLCLACAAQAATLHMRDGRRLRGTILDADSEKVELETEDGVLTIDMSRVSRIDYDRPSGPDRLRDAPAAPPADPPERPPAARPPPGLTPYAPWKPLDFSPGSHMISILPGAVVPLSDVDFAAVDGGRERNGAWGPFIGVQHLYQAGRRLGIGVEADFLHRSRTSTEGLLPLADTRVSGDSWVFLGLARWMLRTKGQARPYLLAGAGGHRTAARIDATPLPGFSWADTLTGETRRLVDDHVWGLAATGRLGVDFFGSVPPVFGLEAGWTWFDNKTYRATPAGEAIGLFGVSKPIHLLTIKARMGFPFGG